MASGLAYLRELLQLDSATLLARWRSLRLHPSRAFTALEVIYQVVLLLTLLVGVASVAIWLLPTKSPQESVSIPSAYSFAQPLQLRQRLLTRFTSGGVEGSDPLWLELRTYLEFAGANARPDALEGLSARFHWMGSGAEVFAPLGKTLYFRQVNEPPAWVQAEGPEPEGLALRASKIFLEGQRMQVELEILRPTAGDPELIESVLLTREIPRKLQELPLFQSLTRSGCRWWGPDLFLLNHAGEDPSIATIAQRIDLGHPPKQQTLYIKPGEGVIQKGQEFESVPLGEASRGHPLWVISRVGEEQLEIIAWNVLGDQNHRLVVQRHNEPWQPKGLEAHVQLAGVRSKEQILLQIDKERWNLKRFDWLLHTKDGWEKLRSAQQIDDYVEGHLRGELLILRSLQQLHASGGWVALFRLYSPARTQFHEFELFTHVSTHGSSVHAGAQASQGHLPPETSASDSSNDALFIPIPEDLEEGRWLEEEARPWEPSTQVSPQKMLEALKSLNEDP